MTKPVDESGRGPYHLERSDRPLNARGSIIPPSGPADPHQRVRNDKFSSEPFRDLRIQPNITGTYFEVDGRYRLFINHVGSHVQCLLTLVVKSTPHHRVAKRLGDDIRLPEDRGLDGYHAPGKKDRRDPTAFRFGGDFTSSTCLLSVPVWLGRTRRTVSRTDFDWTYDLGFLSANADGTRLTITFRGWFVSRWPEVETNFRKIAEPQTLETLALRHDEQPVLLDRYLARESVPYEVRTSYWFQPTPQQTSKFASYAGALGRAVTRVDPERGWQRVSSGGKLMDIFDLLRDERKLGTAHPDPFHRDAIITAIDDIIKKIYDEPISTSIKRGGLGQSELTRLRPYIVELLNSWHLPASGGHGKESLGTALQRAVDRAGNGARYDHLRRHLGVEPRGWRQFRYEIEIEVFKILEFSDKKTQKDYDNAHEMIRKLRKELEKVMEKASETFAKFKRILKYLPVTYLLGHARVKFVGPVGDEKKGPRDEPWEASYGIALAGLRFGKGAGRTSTRLAGSAEVWATTPQAKEDLEGVVSYGQGEVFAGVGAPSHGDDQAFKSGAAGSKSMLTFFGTSQEPAISFFFEGELASAGLSLGLNLKAIVGAAWLEDGTRSRITLDPKSEVEEREFQSYWAREISSLAVHFPINGARIPVPTEEERLMMEEHGLISVKEALDAFTACELPLLVNPLAQVALDGFADAPGAREYNLQLSKNRAESVRNYLHGLLADGLTWGMTEDELEATGRLKTDGHGEPPQGTPGTIEDGREVFDPRERRVDLDVSLAADGRAETSLGWSLMRSDVIRRK
jgi:hypothetical protein